MKSNILIVDDEKEIADLVEVYLKAEGYTVHKCYTAAQALEMGADAVLVNTAIAVADDPVMMARAFRLAVESGLLARQSGPGSRSFQAQATSPLTGFLEASA